MVMGRLLAVYGKTSYIMLLIQEKGKHTRNTLKKIIYKEFNGTIKLKLNFMCWVYDMGFYYILRIPKCFLEFKYSEIPPDLL